MEPNAITGVPLCDASLLNVSDDVSRGALLRVPPLADHDPHLPAVVRRWRQRTPVIQPQHLEALVVVVIVRRHFSGGQLGLVDDVLAVLLEPPRSEVVGVVVVGPECGLGQLALARRLLDRLAWLLRGGGGGSGRFEHGGLGGHVAG